MSNYENLISIAHSHGIKIIETDLGIDKPFGKCIGNLIIIKLPNKRIYNALKKSLTILL